MGQVLIRLFPIVADPHDFEFRDVSSRSCSETFRKNPIQCLFLFSIFPENFELEQEYQDVNTTVY